jgi:hypothetical protein
MRKKENIREGKSRGKRGRGGNGEEWKEKERDEMV